MYNPLRIMFKTKHERDIKKMQPLVHKINALEEKYRELSDEQLKNQTPLLRKQIQEGASFENLLPEAFAIVREASCRVLSLRPYDVQIMGGLTLFNGRIAEMKTGEGKTLTAALPLYLHGLGSHGAHLVTVNDYLARRDAEEMVGPLYRWLGLSVGVILSDMPDEERQKSYHCDLTYGTNNEFAFDYLRDNMKFDLKDYVQREHRFCIVDEVDSILIDEARTPLLISGPSEGNTESYAKLNRVIPHLKRDEDYKVDEKSRTTIFTDEGIIKVSKITGIQNLFDIEHTETFHHLTQALKAHTLFKKDVDYVVKEGRVVIVDEFTGRLKEGSRWSDGLHQAVEAKEGVPIKSENQTLASITFQNYFKLYDKLAGMTGTADTEAEEFRKIYKLDVAVIPTHLPVARIDEADVIYKSKPAKTKAVVNLIKELHEKGRPILVGTNSINSSETFHQALTQANIKHEVLNAKQHKREAQIIEKAGEKGAVTIATNMAGRGTDIKLTEKTKSLGGLFIVGTERNEARRIDNQLRGRSGRQGDPGGSKFFLSLEDDLMRIFGSERIKKIMNTLGMEEDEPIEHRMITNAIAKAQKKVEAHNFEIRKHLLEYDNVMNEQRRVIYRIRRDILGNKSNRDFVNEMMEDVCLFLVDSYRPDRKVPLESWPWSEMQQGFKNTFHTDYQITMDECSQKHEGNIEDYFIEKSRALLSQKLDAYDDDMVKMALREILLSTFDQHWKDHLLGMDHLKEGINLKSYAQRDPLTEYKREGFHLFESMRMKVKESLVRNLFRIQLYTVEEMKEMQHRHQEELMRQLATHKRAQPAQAPQNSSKEGLRQPMRVGRNAPCPCGSGKKFKHCCGS